MTKSSLARWVEARLDLFAKHLLVGMCSLGQVKKDYLPLSDWPREGSQKYELSTVLRHYYPILIPFSSNCWQRLRTGGLIAPSNRLEVFHSGELCDIRRITVQTLSRDDLFLVIHTKGLECHVVNICNSGLLTFFILRNYGTWVDKFLLQVPVMEVRRWILIFAFLCDLLLKNQF
jgi:hypothetical protein